jgi:hypothetical protein
LLCQGSLVSLKSMPLSGSLLIPAPSKQELEAAEIGRSAA